MTKKQQRVVREQSRPPFLLVAAAAALLVLIGGILMISRQPGASPTSVSAGARLVVEPEKIDFGQVRVEQPVTARFVVKNEGSETLQILGQPQVRLVDGC